MHIADPNTQPEFYSSVTLKRLLAWVVDTGLILALGLLILPFTAFLAVFFFPAFLVLISFSYRVITLARGSATWGMRLMAIEFRASDGSRFDLPLAVWHTLGTFISWTVAPLQVISIILMLTSARGQGLTDHILGTVALNKRRV